MCFPPGIYHLIFFFSHHRLKAASTQDSWGKAETKERASLRPECGENFIQNLRILHRQLTSWICTEEIPILPEQRKLSVGYKSRTNKKLYLKKKIPWERLGSRYVTHQAENLSRPLIRDPEIATEVNPFLLWLCGKGAAYPMCHAQRNSSWELATHLTALAGRQEAPVAIPALSHQALNFPWVHWACPNSC